MPFRILPTHYFKNIKLAETLFTNPKFRDGLNITPDWLWVPKSFPVDKDTGEDYKEEDILNTFTVSLKVGLKKYADFQDMTLQI